MMSSKGGGVRHFVTRSCDVIYECTHAELEIWSNNKFFIIFQVHFREKEACSKSSKNHFKLRCQRDLQLKLSLTLENKQQIKLKQEQKANGGCTNDNNQKVNNGDTNIEHLINGIIWIPNFHQAGPSKKVKNRLQKQIKWELQKRGTLPEKRGPCLMNIGDTPDLGGGGGMLGPRPTFTCLIFKRSNDLFIRFVVTLKHWNNFSV